MSPLPKTMAWDRRERLEQARNRLAAGEDVTAQQMRSLLTPDELALYQQAWRDQQELRRQVKDKPDAVFEYERRLQAATFAYSKADAHRGKNAKSMFHKSDVEFERLWEYLLENIAGRSDLEIWFDRPIRNTPDSDAGLTPGTVPMVVTSKSVNNRRGGVFPGIQSKQQVKRDAIEAALDAMDETSTDKDAALARIKSTQALAKRYLDD